MFFLFRMIDKIKTYKVSFEKLKIQLTHDGQMMTNSRQSEIWENAIKPNYTLSSLNRLKITVLFVFILHKDTTRYEVLHKYIHTYFIITLPCQPVICSFVWGISSNSRICYSDRTSPLQMRGCKFRPILGTHGHWAMSLTCQSCGGGAVG